MTRADRNRIGRGLLPVSVARALRILRDANALPRRRLRAAAILATAGWPG